jgi:hypothetical protein
MTYPATLELETLELEHPDFSAIKEELEQIDLLTSGGWRLKREIKDFLPKRAGEPIEVYKERIKKFSYVPILADAIRKQSVRISNGTVNVSGFDPVDADFWQMFREHVDGDDRTEMSLVTKLFTEGLIFGRTYAHVDKPKSPFSPRNQAEEEALGLDPYITLYSALEVTNWSEIDNDDLAWIKVRQMSVDTSNPLAEPRLVCTWTIIDDQFVARYKAFVEVDDDGCITAVLDSSGKPKQKKLVSLVEEIPHGLGVCPVLKFELPSELWLVDQCAGLAYSHLRMNCHLFDLTTAAYFQRTFKRVQTPDLDLDQSFVDSKGPNIGLEHVLELDTFTWNEPKGDILVHLMSALEKTARQIYECISMTMLSDQNKGHVQQSGVSKELDFAMSSESLKAFGRLLCDCLQDLYQLVSLFRGKTAPDLSVSGLDSFETDNLSGLVTDLSSVQQLDLAGLSNALPPSLYILLIEKLFVLLVGNATPEQIDQIVEEVRNGYLPSPASTATPTAA